MTPATTGDGATDRDVLNHQLSILLGFDDGVEDVVEHLLTIGTSEVRRRVGLERNSTRWFY
jgi:hypothetical protein